MMKGIYYSLFFILIFLVHYGDADCFLPSDLTGTWYSSLMGTLNFTQTATNTTIPVYTTSKFGDLSFTCYISSGNDYVLKSSSFNYLGLEFEVYKCLNIQKDTSVKYIYYEGTTENSDADDERFKSELVTSGSTPTLASVCDRASFPEGSEHILLKNDGNEEASSIRFPYDFRGQWRYTYTSSGTAYCVNDSSVNVCVTESAKTMVYDYTKCSTIQAYSANGVLKCMYYTSDSTYTYIHVYNTDSTTDESTTYRFTCYVISRSGTTISATQYPRQCESAQTATNVTTAGAILEFNQTASCPYDTSSTVISSASAAGIAVGLLLLIIIIVCGVLIWFYYKKRKDRDLEKSLLQKAHPANKRLANGSVFVDGKGHGPKTPRAMNGDAKMHLELDPNIRRENSIHISMTSRQGSGLAGLDGERKNGPAPIEEPELAKNVQESSITPSGKYVVVGQRDKFFRSANKRSSIATSSGTERRRFGDTPTENTNKNRKRTPRIRHPMEVQGGSDRVQGQGEVLKKAEDFWKEEKRARSGRRREHPEALPIPSLKEDPFDYRDDKTPGTSAIPQTRNGKSAFGMRPETSNSAFFEPQKDVTATESLWKRASHLWHLTNRPLWNNATS